MPKGKRKAKEKPAPKVKPGRKRVPKLDLGELWQRKELLTDERFIFDLAEAEHTMVSDSTVISNEAQEKAFAVFVEHGIEGVLDRLLELHAELERRGKR